MTIRKSMSRKAGSAGGLPALVGADGVLSPDAAGAVAGAAGRSNGMVQMLSLLGSPGVIVGAAYTFTQSFTLEGEFDAVSFQYANMSTSTPYNVVAKCAASPGVANSGTGLTWANVCFDGIGTINAGDPWDGRAGSTTTGTIPVSPAGGTTADSVPLLNMWTPYTPLQSVANTDAGNADLRVVQVRSYVVTTGWLCPQSPGSSSSNAGNYNTNSRRKCYGQLTAGDQVSTITAVTPQANWQWMPVIGVRAILRSAIYNHGVFDDSISKGQGSFDDNNGLWGWAHRGVGALTDAGIGKHSVFNRAVSGQKKQASWDILVATIKQRGLDTATFRPWSPNDGIAAGSAPWAINNFRYQLATFVRLCRDYAVKPIVGTIPPSVTIADGASDLLRVAFNADIRALASQGITVCDFDAVLSNGASPARYIAGLTNTDNQHPSSAGYAAMALVWQDAVRRALSI